MDLIVLLCLIHHNLIAIIFYTLLDSIVLLQMHSFLPLYTGH